MKEERKVTYMPLWEKHLEMFEEIGLDDSQRGRLVTAMMKYHFNGEQPEKMEPELKAVWFFVRHDLDAAWKQYMQSVENGKKGGAKRKQATQVEAEETQLNPEETRINPEETQINPEETQINPEEAITRTRTESRTESRTRSITRTNTDNGTFPAEAGVSVEKKAYGEFGWVKLTDQQYRSLQDRMGVQTLQDCIRYMDRAAQATGNRHRWRDWQVMLCRCYEEGWYQPVSRGVVQRKTIPKGASGELGEAELEAIRRVLAEDTSPPH